MAWEHSKSRHARGYGSAWERIRASVLRRDSHLCQPCLAKGRPTPATEVHHVKAKADGGTDDRENLVSICRECHDKATAEAKGHKWKSAIGIDGWPAH